MKKYGSQVIVAFVCAILGFLLTYQLKIINKQTIKPSNNQASIDVTAELEQLKKQKEDLSKKVNDLQENLKQYEESAASENETARKLKESLDETRIMVGSTDLTGEGVIIYITPKEAFLLGNLEVDMIPVFGEDLLQIVNQLNSNGAEAISINGIRLTSRTGIVTAGNYIVINDIRISPNERITISAIGNKKNLISGINFPSALPNLPSYEIDIQSSDSVIIPKYGKTFEFRYAKPAKE